MSNYITARAATPYQQAVARRDAALARGDHGIAAEIEAEAIRRYNAHEQLVAALSHLLSHVDDVLAGRDRFVTNPLIHGPVLAVEHFDAVVATKLREVFGRPLRDGGP